MEKTAYDSIIIGGGPAGLSAAIYLGRYNRNVLVIDKGDGRYNSEEINENYLGFPAGIPSRELCVLGRMQAIKFGATIIDDAVVEIKKDNYFSVICKTHTTASKTIIIATGVTDIYPDFEGKKEYIGRSLFWCITCDGYKVRDKTVVVVGNNDDAACTSMQLLNFTKKVQLITNAPKGKVQIAKIWLERLAKFHIPLHEGIIQHIQGTNGMMKSVLLSEDEEIETEYMFNQQGTKPNTSLIAPLGIKLDEHGYIITDVEQRTNIPLIYAAGDVTKNFAHQIVTAAHEGAMAACSANYDLYSPEQK